MGATGAIEMDIEVKPEHGDTKDNDTGDCNKGDCNTRAYRTVGKIGEEEMKEAEEERESKGANRSGAVVGDVETQTQKKISEGRRDTSGAKGKDPEVETSREDGVAKEKICSKNQT